MNYKHKNFPNPCLAVFFMALLGLWACSSTPDHPELDLGGIIPRHYQASFTPQEPHIDGSLQDSVWRRAPWSANFVTENGQKGPAPRYQSRAKMLWDRQYLYLGVWMVDPALQSLDLPQHQNSALQLLLSRATKSLDYRTLLVEPGGQFIESHYHNASAATEGEAAEILVKVSCSGTLDQSGDADRGWWAEIAIPWTSLQQPGQATIPNVGAILQLNLKRQNWFWSPPFQHSFQDSQMWGLVELGS